MNSQMSPETFVKEFGPALQEYLEYQYRNEGHILDLCAASGEFFTVSYHSVDAAMRSLEYNNPATTKRKTTSKK